MTRDEFAAMLNGREYTEEMTREDEGLAHTSRFLVVFGASDDLTEFRGVLDDEAGAYNGCDHRIMRSVNGGKWFVLNEDEDDTEDNRPAVIIEAKWCPAGFDGSWLIETALPHSTFDIMEDGELFCRGVVIDEADMLAAVALPPSAEQIELAALRKALSDIRSMAVAPAAGELAEKTLIAIARMVNAALGE